MSYRSGRLHVHEEAAHAHHLHSQALAAPKGRVDHGPPRTLAARGGPEARVERTQQAWQAKAARVDAENARISERLMGIYTRDARALKPLGVAAAAAAAASPGAGFSPASTSSSSRPLSAPWRASSPDRQLAHSAQRETHFEDPDLDRLRRHAQLMLDERRAARAAATQAENLHLAARLAAAPPVVGVLRAQERYDTVVAERRALRSRLRVARDYEADVQARKEKQQRMVERRAARIAEEEAAARLRYSNAAPAHRPYSASISSPPRSPSRPVSASPLHPGLRLCRPEAWTAHEHEEKQLQHRARTPSPHAIRPRSSSAVRRPEGKPVTRPATAAKARPSLGHSQSHATLSLRARPASAAPFSHSPTAHAAFHSPASPSASSIAPSPLFFHSSLSGTGPGACIDDASLARNGAQLEALLAARKGAELKEHEYFASPGNVAARTPQKRENGTPASAQRKSTIPRPSSAAIVGGYVPRSLPSPSPPIGLKLHRRSNSTSSLVAASPGHHRVRSVNNSRSGLGSSSSSGGIGRSPASGSVSSLAEYIDEISSRSADGSGGGGGSVRDALMRLGDPTVLDELQQILREHHLHEDTLRPIDSSRVGLGLLGLGLGPSEYKTPRLITPRVSGYGYGHVRSPSRDAAVQTQESPKYDSEYEEDEEAEEEYEEDEDMVSASPPASDPALLAPTPATAPTAVSNRSIQFEPDSVASHRSAETQEQLEGEGVEEEEHIATDPASVAAAAPLAPEQKEQEQQEQEGEKEDAYASGHDDDDEADEDEEARIAREAMEGWAEEEEYDDGAGVAAGADASEGANSPIPAALSPEPGPMSDSEYAEDAFPVSHRSPQALEHASAQDDAPTAASTTATTDTTPTDTDAVLFPEIDEPAAAAQKRARAHAKNRAMRTSVAMSDAERARSNSNNSGERQRELELQMQVQRVRNVLKENAALEAERSAQQPQQQEEAGEEQEARKAAPSSVEVTAASPSPSPSPSSSSSPLPSAPVRVIVSPPQPLDSEPPAVVADSAASDLPATAAVGDPDPAPQPAPVASTSTPAASSRRPPASTRLFYWDLDHPDTELAPPARPWVSPPGLPKLSLQRALDSEAAAIKADVDAGGVPHAALPEGGVLPEGEEAEQLEREERLRGKLDWDEALREARTPRGQWVRSKEVGPVAAPVQAHGWVAKALLMDDLDDGSATHPTVLSSPPPVSSPIPLPLRSRRSRPSSPRHEPQPMGLGSHSRGPSRQNSARGQQHQQQQQGAQTRPPAVPLHSQVVGAAAMTESEGPQVSMWQSHEPL